MPARRVVTFHDAFFDRLEELLPAERPGDGTPSRTDFMAFELPLLVELLTTDFEAVTTAVPDIPGVRVMLASGILVDRIAIYLRETDQGSIEGLSLDLDVRLE